MRKTKPTKKLSECGGYGERADVAETQIGTRSRSWSPIS